VKQDMSWQNEVDELRRREELAKRTGGPDKIKRQRGGGKLTVRERIDRSTTLTAPSSTSRLRIS
jgi:acetyl-CoA carboxylase carboxyltransferase component